MPTMKEPTMDPATAIGPTPLIRRKSKARWHIARDVETVGVELPEAYPSPHSESYRQEFRTLCDQIIRSPEKKLAFNATEVSCDDCLVAAISKGGAKR